MAKNQGRIGFGVDFNVNTASLNQVKSALADLKKLSAKEIQQAGGTPWIGAKNNMNQGLKDMRAELSHLEQALEKAYNPKLGTFELTKFNQALNTTEHSAKSVFNALQDMGAGGNRLILTLSTNMLAVDRAAKQTSSTIKKLGETMMNTIRWTITSSAINMVTGSLQQAYHYAVDLDGSLNDIRIVTNKSADEMDRFARSANKAAKTLGASTKDYTDASLIYYQQGLNDAEVAARTETTLKAAAVTGQSADTVSEQLTAVWNGYKVNAAEAELYIDKLSAVAATTAADLAELSTGMSKVASAASIMGVDIDQLNAQLATIVSVTREAPESVGTALKTVYARMSDIEAGLDTETTLGEYTAQMAQMGINVLDAQGNLRDMGAVVEEIGTKWSALNREQQTSLAQSIAGTRQYSRMMALFDNWDMYQKALITSTEAAGALSRQHARYLESIEAHQEKLKASAEGLYDSIFNSEEVKGVYDVLSGVVTAIDHIVQSIGGMPGILTLSLSLFTKIAKTNIADLVTRKKINAIHKEANERQLAQGVEYINEQRARMSERNEALNAKIANTQDTLKQAQDNKQKIEIKKQSAIAVAGGDLHSQQEAEFEQALKNEQKIIKEKEQELAVLQKIRKEEEMSTAQLKKTLDLEEKIYQAAEKSSLSNEEWAEAQALVREINGDYETFLALQEEEAAIRAKRQGADYSHVRFKNVPSSENGLGWDLEKAENRDLALQQLSTARQELKWTSLAAATRELKKTEESRKELEASNDPKKQGKINQLLKQEKQLRSDIAKLKAIEADENTIKIIEAQLKAEERITAELKEQGKVVEDNELRVKEFINSLETQAKGEKFAEIVDAISTVAFAASIGSGAVDSFMSALSSGEGMVGSIISTILTMAGAFTPLIITLITTKGTAEATWAAVTLGASAAIAVLSAVVTAFSNTAKAKKEERKETIDEANAALEAAQANKILVESYEKLYDTYSQTNIITDELKSATEELIEVYDIENGELLLKQRNYDLLAEKIKKAREAEIEKTHASNINKRNAALGQLNENIKGVSDSQNDQGGYTIFFDDGNMNTSDEGKNLEILQQAIDSVSGATMSVGSDGSMTISTTSPLAYAQLYEALNSAYEQMENKSKSEIAKNVKQILDDESFASGSENYIAASKALLEEETIKKIGQWDIPASSGTLAQLTTQKESLKAELQASEYAAGFTDEEIDALIEDRIRAEGGAAARLQERQDWIEMNQQEYGLDFSSLEDELSLNKMGALEFNMLQSLNAQEYQNNLDGMIADAKKKAQESIDQVWADAKDARLAASNKEISRLENESNKATGKEKIKLIDAQNKELKEQIALLKKIDVQTAKTNAENAKNSFKDLAKKYDFSNSLLNAENWDIEAIRSAIDSQMAGNVDAEQALVASLVAYSEAQSAYNDELEAIEEKEAQLYKNKIRQYEAEIEAIDTLQSKYQGLIDSLSAIANLYKTMYGENEFSKVSGLYNDMLKVASRNVANNRGKIASLQAQLQDSTLSDVDRQKLEADLNAAFGESIAAVENQLTLVREAFVNNINAAFQISAAKATNGKSLDVINKDWEYRTEDSEKYLDNIQKSYAIETLERDVLERINTLTNTRAQQRITSVLKDELKLLRERDKLTQADVERAERKVQLLEAEIALEQARENRSQMRLVRGANGMYSYQYVADQRAITEAERVVSDTKNAVYEADKTDYETSITEFSEAYNRYVEELGAAGNDQQLIKMINERYKTQLSEIVARNQELYATMQGYGADVNSAAQTWMNELAKNDQAGLMSVLAQVEKASLARDYTSALDTANSTLKYIYAGMVQLAETEQIKLSPLPKNTAQAESGAYTGSWGSEPKVLLAHEKELILNKTDTSNILNAVALVRKLNDSMLDNIASMDLKFDSSFSTLEMARELILQQNVHITAEFPNATDRSEIEAAFEEIVGLATQHATNNVRGK